MFHLTREVRFAVGAGAGAQQPEGCTPNRGEPDNAFAGWPPLEGVGQYLALAVTIAGELDPASQYLLNIRDIDRGVRGRGIGLIERLIRGRPGDLGSEMLLELFDALRTALPLAQLESLQLKLSPFLSLSALGREIPMTRLSQRFEFSASHRLHNPALSDEENCRIFGKCNNPHGHGHNYEVQVTVAGRADAGMVIGVGQLERIVREAAIDRFDHRNLNVECPEFASLIPTVENIARVIFGLLKAPLGREGVRLASVTVWETPKTWCEYTEE